MTTARDTVRADRGSVLMLFPAAVLVIFVLGVISVDAGSAYLARRSLTDTVTESADAAAARAVDLSAFYATPSVLRIDPTQAQHVIADVVGLQRRDGGVEILDEVAQVTPDGRQVTVVAVGRVRQVFAFGAARRDVTVRARATATVSEVRVRQAL